jgi:hypothetical protein
VIEDRSTAILGKMGAKVERVPFDVKLVSDLQNRSFHYDIVDSLDSVLQFVPMLVVNSFIQYESKSEASTIVYKFKIKTDFQSRSIEVFDSATGFHNSDTLTAIAKNISSILSEIVGNGFLPIKILGIELEMKLANEVRVAEIYSIFLDKLSYEPGQTVTAKVTLNHYREAPETREISLKIPETIKPGIYPLILSSGDFFLKVDSRFNPDKYNPRHPSRLFDLLSLKITSRTLSLWMFGNDDSLWVSGKEYSRLPTFQRDMIESSRYTGVESGAQFVTSDLELEDNVIGRAMTRILIEPKKFSEK